jgi:hypothetical protein
VILDNTYSVGTACATTVQNVKEITYLLYSQVNIYKLNTEKTTTFRKQLSKTLCFVSLNASESNKAD